MRRALGFMGGWSSRAQRLSCREQPGRRSRPCGLRVALASASQGTRALCPGHCRYETSGLTAQVSLRAVSPWRNGALSVLVDARNGVEQIAFDLVVQPAADGRLFLF